MTPPSPLMGRRTVWAGRVWGFAWWHAGAAAIERVAMHLDLNILLCIANVININYYIIMSLFIHNNYTLYLYYTYTVSIIVDTWVIHDGSHASDMLHVLALCLPRESLITVPQIPSISFFQQQNINILVRSISCKNYTFLTITSLGYYKEDRSLHTIY